jgi:hypothetical protein
MSRQTQNGVQMYLRKHILGKVGSNGSYHNFENIAGVDWDQFNHSGKRSADWGRGSRMGSVPRHKGELAGQAETEVL